MHFKQGKNNVNLPRDRWWIRDVVFSKFGEFDTLCVISWLWHLSHKFKQFLLWKTIPFVSLLQLFLFAFLLNILAIVCLFVLYTGSIFRDKLKYLSVLPYDTLIQEPLDQYCASLHFFEFFMLNLNVTFHYGLGIFRNSLLIKSKTFHKLHEHSLKVVFGPITLKWKSQNKDAFL